MAIATINPATGETLQEFDPLTDEEIEAKLVLAETAFQNYRFTSWDYRSQLLKQAADILEQDRDRLAKAITLEMGKTIKSAKSEIEKCALVCRFYADNGPSFLADQVIGSDAKSSFIRYQPLGIILAVMPWNFPFWQVFRFAAPALMAGNVGLLKHASNVPLCALAIEEVFKKAGYPAGTFQTLLIPASKVNRVLQDVRVKAATLTGSESAGMSLAMEAGRQIKKTVLELGGSDPFIVTQSADLEAAVTTAVSARMINNGQSCIAAKRFILLEAIADQFQEMLLEKYLALKVGDPMLADTDIGPLATGDILTELDELVQKCIAQGARLLTGGKPFGDRRGHYYPPTILTDLPKGTVAEDEEFFGPVALLFRVPDLDSAIKLANKSPFGLGASAWTQIPEESERLINEIEAGAVFINGMVKSDPRLPFGGIKKSGYGRELGAEGIREFVNIKTVWVK